MKISLVAFLLLSSIPVNAHEFRAGYSHSRVCSQTIYKEQYIPGTLGNPGYVKSWKEAIQVPCYRTSNHHHHYHRSVSSYRVSRSNDPITSSCNSAAKTTTGGLLGGGLAAALSKKDAYGWSIPLGAVLGIGVANSDC
tara:strand:- start:3440 stop:3853 length:414 start_codon:yes stop_codon:yes gene_type:complete